MPTENNGALLYVQAITSLHAGSGTAMGAVDLPIQRERHTKWPVIPGSSLKGVLRESCRLRKDADCNKLFGHADDTDAAAGLFSFTDARLLAFPVRSLMGAFAWVTCPQALRRWERDARIAGLVIELPAIEEPAEGEAVVGEQCPCVHQDRITLEEFQLRRRVGKLPALPILSDQDASRLVLLDDTSFTYFAEYATEVTARIRLTPETKTVQPRALFYQEFLPAETILYSLVLLAQRPKTDAVEALWNELRIPETVQIGGDETIGRGLCNLTVCRNGRLA